MYGIWEAGEVSAEAGLSWGLNSRLNSDVSTDVPFIYPLSPLAHLNSIQCGLVSAWRW